MEITLTAAQLTALKAFLSKFEDCEALSESEYVVDLYDQDPPLSIDLLIQKNGIFVEGAAKLMFDEEMDGWYIGERINEPAAVLDALNLAGALEV